MVGSGDTWEVTTTDADDKGARVRHGAENAGRW